MPKKEKEGGDKAKPKTKPKEGGDKAKPKPKIKAKAPKK
jgi:hypothetical protein